MSDLTPLSGLRDSVSWPVLPVTAPLPIRKTQDLEPFSPNAHTTSGSEESRQHQESTYEAPEDETVFSEQVEEETLASVMTSEVIVIYPEQTVADLEALLHEHRISGVPVVDASTGELLGVASQADVIRHFSSVDEETALPSEGVAGYHQTLWFDLFATPVPSERKDTPVSKIMTPYVYFATETASIEEALELMLEHRIHRVVVTRERKLVGVVTSMDLLRRFQSQLRGSLTKP